MNFRDPTPPPEQPAASSLPDLSDVTGKPVKFEIAAYFDRGKQRRNFHGAAVVKEGGELDIPGLLITALTEIRNQGNFPDGVTRLELKAERTP